LPKAHFKSRSDRLPNYEAVWKAEPDIPFPCRKYTYDALNDLLTVKQNAQSSSYQTRTYDYDGLGRVTSEKNPETKGSDLRLG